MGGVWFGNGDYSFLPLNVLALTLPVCMLVFHAALAVLSFDNWLTHVTELTQISMANINATGIAAISNYLVKGYLKSIRRWTLSFGKRKNSYQTVLF